MKDVIADMLETVKFKSAIYFKHGFCGEWGMDIPAGVHAQFHFVTGGRCFIQASNPKIELSRGDLVIFPKGQKHQIKSQTTSQCVPGKKIVDGISRGDKVFDEGPITTQLICGHYEMDREVSHFLLSELPDMILIKNEDHRRL